MNFHLFSYFQIEFKNAHCTHNYTDTEKTTVYNSKTKCFVFCFSSKEIEKLNKLRVVGFTFDGIPPNKPCLCILNAEMQVAIKQIDRLL